MHRVTSVSYDGYDLTELVHDFSVSLDALNSTDTIIFSSGIVIFLPPITTPLTENTKKKAKLICSRDVMLRKAILEESMDFLQWEGDIDVEPEIHEQIKQKLYSLFKEIDLGYCDRDQEAKLKSHVGHLQITL